MDGIVDRQGLKMLASALKDYEIHETANNINMQVSKEKR